MRARLVWWVSCFLLAASCRSEPSEPPPPPAHYELVVAPPGARGARAAGTDAAPPLPTDLGTADPDEPEGSEDDDGDAGEAEGGAVEPDTEGGVAL